MRSQTVEELAVSTDLPMLRQSVSGVLGKRCWKVVLGYGRDLHLHLGGRFPYENPKMAGEKRGEWGFASCGTAWRLYMPGGTVFSDKGSERTLERKAKAIEGGKLVHFGVDALSSTLYLAFHNSCMLLVTPTPEDDEYDLPYWELFTPDHMVVVFGPGRRWSLKRADSPLSG